MSKVDIEQFRRQLRKIERDIFNMTKSESNCCGVTSAQCHALLELSFLGEASIKELAAALNSDKSNLSRTVDTLVEKSLVIRESSPEDRRTLKVKLSESGEEKVHYINDLCNKYYNKILAEIPEEKHNSIIESLFLLSEAYDKLNREGLTICALQNEKEAEL